MDKKENCCVRCGGLMDAGWECLVCGRQNMPKPSKKLTQTDAINNKENEMSKAKLILEKDKVTLVVEKPESEGHFKETYIIDGYDSMPEARAREVAELLGIEIID